MDGNDERARERAASGSSDDRSSNAFDADDEVPQRAHEESSDDLALRGAAASGALGGVGAVAGAVTGFGGALGVNLEAGEQVQPEDEDFDR